MRPDVVTIAILKLGTGLGYWFTSTGALILATTGIGKIWSVCGTASLLRAVDPVLGIRFRMLLLTTGIAEIVIALTCLSTRRLKLAATLIAWVSTMFLVYRIGLWSVHWDQRCPCLGQLADALPISASTADALVKAALAYLLAGSYVLLFAQWRRGAQRAAVSVKQEEGPVESIVA